MQIQLMIAVFFDDSIRSRNKKKNGFYFQKNNTRSIIVSKQLCERNFCSFFYKYKKKLTYKTEYTVKNTVTFKLNNFSERVPCFAYDNSPSVGFLEQSRSSSLHIKVLQ